VGKIARSTCEDKKNRLGNFAHAQNLSALRRGNGTRQILSELCDSAAWAKSHMYFSIWRERSSDFAHPTKPEDRDD
jgi:hypothetical protein